MEAGVRIGPESPAIRGRFPRSAIARSRVIADLAEPGSIWRGKAQRMAPSRSMTRKWLN